MKSLCVIPARGGSKRIPRKNIREFCGKPIIAYSIEAALQSGVFDTVMVSTDDPEIAEVAQHYGAEVPFVRPGVLSDDLTPTRPVIQHAVKWYQERGHQPEVICWMHAASPLIHVDDVRTAYNKLKESRFQFVFTATRFEYPIQRALQIMPDQSVQMFQPEHLLTRSQDLPEAYHDAGQFYIGQTSSVMDGTPVFSASATIVEIPAYRSQDIDSFDDWKRAELIYELHSKPQKDHLD